MPFQPADFDAAVRLATADAAGWTRMDADLGSLALHKRPRAGAHGLNEYLVTGTLPHPPAVIHDTFMDLDYRRVWDGATQEDVLVLAPPSPDAETALAEGLVQRARTMTVTDAALAGISTDTVHWIMAYPWPMQPREYIVTRESRRMAVHGTRGWVVLQATLPPSPATHHVPEPRAGVVRVDAYMHAVVLTPAQDGRATRIYYHYFEDPKGAVPQAIINWAVQSGIPAWLRRFTRACEDYASGSTRDDVLAAGLRSSAARQGAKELERVLDASMERAFAM